MTDWGVSSSPYLKYIVHTHWHEIEYKLDTWRSSELGKVRCKDYNLSTWRSFVQNLFDVMIVHWDHPHRLLEITHVIYGPRESPMVHELSMYFWEVSCIYSWKNTEYSEAYHFIVSYCIAFQHILHSWCLCTLFGA